ncbi:MAG: nucleotide sugar dehydrogenase [Candidatus Aenigmarchaeota archaeon]|nr:nucleotide sugar dehydrogenase [Candidatus Aenigmarchaeota archaeon]
MIKMKDTKICVIGLGYVGQTLAVTLADVGFNVYGIDIDRNILERFKSANSHVKEPMLNEMIKKYIDKKLFAGTWEDFDIDFDYFIICVNTPFDKEKREPNLKYVLSVSEKIKEKLRKGQTVIVRSTVPVGTTRSIIKKKLEETGLVAGKDFYLSFAQERTIEGAALRELRELPQIIGGINKESIDKAREIFEKITDTIIPVSSLESAEIIKLIDNSFRDLIFAYSNELTIFCEKVGVNLFEIVKVANFKYPRNKIPIPSPGVGGPCLSKDPYIFNNSAERFGEKLELCLLSRKINENIPVKIVERLDSIVPLSEKNVFVVGFAFKGDPETSDMRESPTLTLVNALKGKGAIIYGYDPSISGDTIRQLDVKAVDTLSDGLKNADVAIFMTNNKRFRNINIKKLFSIMSKGSIVYDGWGMFDRNVIEELGLKYLGVGIG